MSNFWTRTITGTLFVVVMVGCIFWNYWSMTGLFLVISILGLWEFYSLLDKFNYSPQKFIGILLAVSLLVANSYYIHVTNLGGWESLRGFGGRFFTIQLLLVSFFLICCIELFRKKENPFINIALTIFGICYIAFPFAYLISIDPFIITQVEESTGHSYSPYKILGFLILIWSNDTFAYLVGRAIGRTKLFERISPKKTWEGTIGGVICTQGIAYVLSIYFTELAPIHWHVVALIVSVFGTLGDLVESMFKRSLDIKDSGTILPGHGGILDRFDAVLLASPFVVTYLMLVR